MKMPGRSNGPKFLSRSLKNGEGASLGAHDLVRRMDRQGEVLIWCRNCSGNARQGMEPKLINCCMPEPMGTKEFGDMVKRLQTLEEGRVPAKEAKYRRIEGEKNRITRKECRRLLNNFEMEGLMAKKASGSWQKRKMMERGELPNEEGDVVKEFKACMKKTSGAFG